MEGKDPGWYLTEPAVKQEVKGVHFLGQAHSSGPVLVPEPSRGSIGRRKRVREAPPTRQGSETEEAASTPSTPQRVRVHLSA